MPSKMQAQTNASIERRDPARDYMQDPDVRTVGDAIAKIDAEVAEEYREAGEPGGLISANDRLDWALRRAS